MMDYYTKDSLETIEVGKKIGSILKPNDVILLVGDLSAGKTTITKGIGISLGVNKIINSPTFTIVKEYKGINLKLFHLDLYRLDGLDQDFDLEEYMDSGNVCVIEWPYQVKEILPNEYILINIDRLNENERNIHVSFIGDKYKNYEEMLKCIH